jgi:hypothetical protein
VRLDSASATNIVAQKYSNGLVCRLPTPFSGRSWCRASVERAFGRSKNEWGLLPLRVRGIERVRLYADLTILSQLTCALNRERIVALAA